MKCPICGKDLELKNKQIGTSENGEPIFNEYAICRDCRKQWNLDKQRAKKMAAKKAAAQKTAVQKAAVQKAASEKPAAQKAASPKTVSEKPAVQKTVPSKKAAVSEKAPVRQNESSETAESTKKLEAPKKSGSAKKPVSKKAAAPNTDSSHPASAKAKRRPEGEAHTAAPVKKKPVKKRAPQTEENSGDEKRYSNIPSEKVRTKHEKAARQGYEDMLATGTISKPDKKKKQLKDETKSLRSANTEKPDTSPVKNDDYDDYDDDYYEDTPRFRVMRIILAILSLAGFAYFIFRGFTTGLTGTADSLLSPGMVYVILALCMLVSALLYFIMLGTNTVFAFLLPMIFYLGSGVFAFLNRGDDLQVLIAAVASAVLAVISLILAITSRGGDDYEDEDDYDDAFEDDYADDYED